MSIPKMMVSSTAFEVGKLKLCSCRSGLVAKYYCDEEFKDTCKIHESHFRYCKNCSSKDKHDHRSRKIIDRCNEEYQ